MAMFHYESEDIANICQGSHSSDTLYVAECKKTIIDGVKGSYPQLCEYEKEWLMYGCNHYEGGTPSNLEYQSVTVIPNASVENAIPFHYKRAILKGNTERVFSPLKNLFDGFLEIGSIDDNNGVLISNTKYYRSVNFIVVEPSTIYIISTNGSVNGRLFYYDINFNFISTSVSSDVALSPSNAKYMKFRVDADKKDNKIQVEKNNVVTDYEDPNYILQSVKMPVLTTTGNNLFDKNCALMDYVVFSNGTLGTSNGNGVTDFIKVTKGKTYVKNGDKSSLAVYNSSKTFIERVSSTDTYTSDVDGYIRWNISSIKDVIDTLQIEEGTTTTSYKPYQSSILTVNEEVELRGIGEVQDEVNLLTGELTQRIGEVVLDGSEDWVLSANDNSRTFYTTLNHLVHTTYYLNRIRCDKLVVHSDESNLFHSTSPNGISGYADWTDSYPNENWLYIKYTDSEGSVEKLKQWLSQNPITVQYQMTTESVKTVALSHQIKPYEGDNHYQTSSDTIPPIAELSVPVVSTGAQTLNEILTAE